MKKTRLLSIFCGVGALALIACDDTGSSASETSKGLTDLKVSEDDLKDCSSKMEGSLFVVDNEINVCSDKKWITLLCDDDSEAASVKFSGDSLATIFCDEDSVGVISNAEVAGCAIKTKKSTVSLVCDGDTLASYKITQKDTDVSSSSSAKSGGKSSSSEAKSDKKSSSSEAKTDDKSSSSSAKTNEKSSSSSETPVSSSSVEISSLIDDFEDNDEGSPVAGIWGIGTYYGEDTVFFDNNLIVEGVAASRYKVAVANPDGEGYVGALLNVKSNGRFGTDVYAYIFHIAGWHDEQMDGDVVDNDVFDISSCKEITYKYKGPAHAFELAMRDEDKYSNDNYRMVIASSKDWKKASVKISEMKQEGFSKTVVTLNTHAIKTMRWSVQEGGSLYIDDIRCVGGEVKMVNGKYQSSSSQTPSSSSSSSLARDKAFSFLDDFVVWSKDGKTASIKESETLIRRPGDVTSRDEVRELILGAIEENGYENKSGELLDTEKKAEQVGKQFGIRLSVDDYVFAKQVDKNAQLGDRVVIGSKTTYAIAVNSTEIAVLIESTK